MPKWYCGGWAWINEATGEVKPFYCGLATCDREQCQKMYWLKRVRLISALITKYKLYKFFTLTMDTRLNQEDAWYKISNIWTNTRRGLRRDYDNFLFVSILEANKKGYPHIHGFTNTWISTTEWGDRFEGCGGGHYAWVEKVKSGDISEYVSKEFNVVKYVGKSQVVTAKKYLKKRQRSLWRSKGMKADFELENGDGEWTLDKEAFFVDKKLGVDILEEMIYNREYDYYLHKATSTPCSEGDKWLIRKVSEKMEF